MSLQTPFRTPTLTGNMETPESEMMVVQKRNGKKERVRVEKISARIDKLCYGLDMRHVDVGRVVQRVVGGLFSGVTTCKLDSIAASTCHMLSSLHTDYGTLAARIFVSNLHKETKKEFSQVMEDLYRHIDPTTKEWAPLINERLYNDVMANKDALDSAIVYDRDFNYSYFGLKTLVKSYLKDINGKTVERPQHLLMRVAVALNGRDLNEVFEAYDLLHNMTAIFATPILMNGGTAREGLTSCFLLAATQEGDSIDNIYDLVKECAMISRLTGGIGMSIHDIRAEGSVIRSTNGKARGIVPMLKVFDVSADYVTQSDKRKGSIAVYLEPWHAEIFEFLKLRGNDGQDEFRARNLNYGLWIPDLFMEKVKAEEEWCLFSPSEAPGLSEAYGDEFKQLYEKYERAGRYRKKVSARKLMFSIIESQIKTGNPYMLYKDACNRKNNQKHRGTLRSSNLCCEILELSTHEETSCCNLASIGLPAMIRTETDGTKRYDFDELHRVAGVLVKNLNKVIDITTYPGEKARLSNFRHRPIGIGVSGLADTFAILNMPFESDEARALNKEIFETIYHGVLTASCELSKKLGPYSSFAGSEFSKGKLQFDLWEEETGIRVKHSGRWDWDTLKKDIVAHGTRNSLLTALMPTASTSQIIGYAECFEPFNRLVYKRETLAGESVVANKYLLKELCDLGVWNQKMKQDILRNRGSVQRVENVPEHIQRKYKNSFDLSQRVIIDMAADRAPYIDQSQSMNVFISDPNYEKMTTLHFLAWDKRLKTGMYYLKQPPVVDPISDLDRIDDFVEPGFATHYDYIPQEDDFTAPACSRDDPECLMCSA